MAQPRYKTQFVDHAGKQFNSWTVLSRAPNPPYSRTRWNCRCACGIEKVVLTSHLVSGASKGCTACFHLRATGRGSGRFKHGQSTSQGIYSVWCGMIQRCENPKNKHFHNYGGRGIAVCKEWREDFNAFARDMGERPSPKHQIDRINNDLGYAPAEEVRRESYEQMRADLMIVIGMLMALSPSVQP